MYKFKFLSVYEGYVSLYIQGSNSDYQSLVEYNSLFDMLFSPQEYPSFKSIMESVNTVTRNDCSNFRRRDNSLYMVDIPQGSKEEYALKCFALAYEEVVKNKQESNQDYLRRYRGAEKYVQDNLLYGLGRIIYDCDDYSIYFSNVQHKLYKINTFIKFYLFLNNMVDATKTEIGIKRLVQNIDNKDFAVLINRGMRRKYNFDNFDSKVVNSVAKNVFKSRDLYAVITFPEVRAYLDGYLGTPKFSCTQFIKSKFVYSENNWQILISCLSTTTVKDLERERAYVDKDTQILIGAFCRKYNLQENMCEVSRRVLTREKIFVIILDYKKEIRDLLGVEED